MNYTASYNISTASVEIKKMLWTANICRICARISEICIPIFEEDTTSGVETKIRRCLNANVSKEVRLCNSTQ